MRGDALTLLAALVLCGVGAPGGDPASADALWAHAQQTSGGDLAHPLFIDATRELARIRPWQSGYSKARERLDAVGKARLRLR